MSDDLKVLFPEVVVEVKGEALKVSPFFFGHLSRVAKLVKPIAEAMLSSGILTIKLNEDNTTTITLQDGFIPKLFNLAADVGEPLMALIAFGSGKDRNWMDTVPIDDGIKLARAVWEVNSDFFVKRVLPMLDLKAIGFNSTGATSSQGSSTPATEEQTSTVTP